MRDVETPTLTPSTIWIYWFREMPIEPPDPHEHAALDALHTAVRELRTALALRPTDVRLAVAFAQASAAAAILGTELPAPASQG